MSLKQLSQVIEEINQQATTIFSGWVEDQYPELLDTLSKMCGFTSKVLRQAKKQENMAHMYIKKQVIETAFEGAQMTPNDKNFQAATINMFQELKEIMPYEIKEDNHIS